MTNLKNKLLSGTLYNYIGYIANAAIGFFIYQLIVKSISVGEYGNYSTFLTTFEYCLMFLGFGIYSSLYRYPSELVTTKSYKLLKKFIGYTLLFQIAVSILGIVLFVIFKTNYLKAFDLHNASDSIILFYILIPIQMLNFSALAILDSLLMQKIRNIAEVAYLIIKFAGLFVIYKYSSNLYSTMLIFFIATFIWTLINFLFIAKSLCKLPSVDESSDTTFFSRVKHYSLYNYSDTIGESIVGLGFDILIISNILGAASAGLYSFAVGMVKMVYKLLPVNICYKVIKPILIQKYTVEKDKNFLILFFTSYLKLHFFLIAPIIWGGFFLGKDIILLLFKKEYLDSFNVFAISLISLGLFYSFWNPIGSLLTVLEKPEISFYSKIFMIFNLIAGIILTKKLGITGPIIATAVTNIFTIIMQIILLRKHISLNIPWISLLKINLNSILMFSVLFYSAGFLPVKNIFILVLYISVGAIVFFTASFFNKAFNETERNIINGILKRKLFYF